ncbi:MAG: PAS domain-containing protein [Oligoflexia bacterium]|nr:PAS domain-containing protein [Oligoflexia bacterium]
MSSFDFKATYNIIKIMEVSKEQEELNFNNAPVVMAIISENGQILKGNEFLAKLFSVDNDELISKNLQQLFDQKSWQTFFKYLDNTYQLKQNITFNLSINQIHPKTSAPIIYLWNVSYVSSYNCRPLKMFMLTGQDISEIIFAQQSLERINQDLERKVNERTQELQDSNRNLIESKQMLRNVLDTIPVRVYWKDRHLKYLGCNDLYAKDLNLKLSEEVVNKSDEELEWKYKERLTDFDKQVLNSSTNIVHHELKNSLKEGNETECWQKISIIPLKDYQLNNIGVLGVYEDITEAKKAERERERLQKEVMISSKLASIGLLTAGVSHEINNPTVILMGHLFRLKKYFTGNEEAMGVWDKAIYACNRIVNIVKGMSLQIKNEQVEAVNDKLDIHRVITETVDFVKDIFKNEKNIDIEVSMNAQNKFVKANEETFKRCLMNLLNNAKDALETNPQERKKLILVETKNDKENNLVVKIKDNGTGIAEDIQNKIFDPFFTTKPPGKGTGLGLGLVHSALKEIGGKITFETKEGEGSSFYLQIPLVND